MRNYIKSKSFSNWVALHKEYPQFFDVKNAILQDYLVYIVTTKNIQAVKDLLIAFDVNISKQRLWTMERMANKLVAIESIAIENNINPAEITFVDDHPGHLEDVSTSGAQCLWAKWGYFKENLSQFKPITHLSELLGGSHGTT